MADTHHVVAAHGRVNSLGGDALRAVVVRLAARLPMATPGSHVVFAFDVDHTAFVVALLATWHRGHAVALPASARRRHVGPVMARPEVVALVHDTGAGLGIDVTRWLANDTGSPHAAAPADLAVTGPVSVFAPDGSVRQVPATELDAAIERAQADLQLTTGTRVANLCPPGSAAAMVPGLLAPLAAGAIVTGDVADAEVRVVPAGAAVAPTAARVVEITDAPDVPPVVPVRQPLVFATVPTNSGEPARFRTTVPRDFFGFLGHFPGYPVLSGAVQLHELVLPCLCATCERADVAAFQDLKFLARIAPGDTVEVTMRHDPARGTCEFEIVRGTTKCSGGRVLLRAADGEAAS